MFARVREASFRSKYELGIRQFLWQFGQEQKKKWAAKKTTIRLPSIATHFTSTPLAPASSLSIVMESIAVYTMLLQQKKQNAITKRAPESKGGKKMRNIDNFTTLSFKVHCENRATSQLC